MKRTILAIAAILAFCPVGLTQEEPKEPDAYELAEKETESLQRLLKLDDGQAFYVDSILQSNYIGLMESMKKLQKSRVSNSDIYMNERDAWMQKTYDAYKLVFTDEQWAAYLKSGGAREQKARDKRKAAMQAALSKTKKK